jgi:hypothetical protein
LIRLPLPLHLPQLPDKFGLEDLVDQTPLTDKHGLDRTVGGVAEYDSESSGDPIYGFRTSLARVSMRILPSMFAPLPW